MLLTIKTRKMISKLFQYYLDNQSDLVKKYNGKYVVITKDCKVEAYDNEDEAYFQSEQKYGLGNFLLQLCTPGDSAYTLYYNTPRAVF